MAQSSDPDLDAVMSSLDAPAPKTGDPDLDAVLTAHATATASSPTPPKPSYLDQVSANSPVLGYLRHAGTGIGASILATGRSIGDALHGDKLGDIDERNRKFIASQTYNPPAGSPAAVATKVMESPFNPVNYPSWITDKIGKGVTAATGSTVAGPVTEGLLNLGLSLAPLIKGVLGSGPPKWDRQTQIPPEPFVDEVPAGTTPEGGPAPAARAQVLQDIGLTRARTSALTNDGPAAMSEFQTSKDPTTPQGAEAHRIFTQERSALSNFADSIVNKTGGSAGTDASTLEARGNTILKPFDDLTDYFDEQRKAAYQAADARAQGVATDLKGFQDTLHDESNLTNQDRVGLRGGLGAYLKKLGVQDENGNITASVQQAETIRKYLNDEWSPQNSKFVGKLKDALDEDVTRHAGEDIYQPARAIVQKQKAILENPKGIADVLDASGPNGINRKVPVGQVADKITNLPPAQLKHIVDTLQDMPPEIKPQADAALAELRSHFASRLSDTATKFDGPWNHKGVNQFLDNNSARAPILFGEDSPVLKDMNTLRSAGNILRVDRGYPGAAIQGRILQSKLLPGAIAGGGTLVGEAIGSALGAPGLGSMAGGTVGTAAALRMSQRAGYKALQARMTNLSDLAKPPP